MKTDVFVLAVTCCLAGCHPTPPPAPTVAHEVVIDAATTPTIDVAVTAVVDVPPVVDVPVDAGAAADAPAAPVEPTLVYHPSVSESEPRMDVIGFPALSDDGATLLTTVSASRPDEGARLTVQLRDAHTGAVRRALVVVDRADSRSMFNGLNVTPALERRVQARVAAALAVLGPMHPHALPVVAEAQDDNGVRSAAGWSVLGGDGAGVLTVRRDTPTPVLSARPRFPPMSEALPHCGGSNDPRVDSFFPVAADRLLLHVNYRGNDTCYEGPDNWLLVTAR